MSTSFRRAYALLFYTGILTTIANACPETVNPVADPDSLQYAVMHISMFGAVPDNPCNDQLAFEAAAAWFNARGGNGELHFDDGLYIVGAQAQDPDFYRAGRSPLHFMHCSNLTLVGRPGTIIKYEDCLLYGAFDHLSGGSLIYPCGVSGCAQNQDVAFLGPCIHLEQCSRITIEVLALDGNMDDLRIGGRTEYDGWQREHTGVVIDDSWDITLRDLNVSQFCLDGMYIRASVLTEFMHGDDMQIGFDHCSFSRNGRTGFSWLGGAGVSGQSSTFDYNGTYLVRSAPGAGMDIEYHYFVSFFDSAPIGNGTFASCSYRYNKGSGVIADVPPDDAYLPYVPGGFNFISCTFVGAERGVALYPNAPGMRFTYCRVHGRTTRPFDCQRTGDLSDHTHFEQCTFDETYFDPEQNQLYSMSWSSPQEGSYHLFVAGVPAGGLTLVGCSLHTYCRLMPFIIFGGPANSGQPNYHAKMLGCTYIYEGAHIPTNPPTTLPDGEYTANYGQFSQTEVDFLAVTYPNNYNLSLLVGTDIQIHQAYDNAFSPAEIFANYWTNLLLNAQPPSAFPFYGICPQKYLDPAVEVNMCNQCADGCALCATIIPPPAHNECEHAPVKSSYAGPIGYQAQRDQDLVPSVDDARGSGEFWMVSDLLGRRVGDFTNEQERLAVMGPLPQGGYLLTKFDPTSGNILGQFRFFRP